MLPLRFKPMLSDRQQLRRGFYPLDYLDLLNKIYLTENADKENPLIVEAEGQALIFENSFGGDAIIYTDGSVIQHV
jgi:hypothetical protein